MQIVLLLAAENTTIRIRPQSATRDGTPSKEERTQMVAGWELRSDLALDSTEEIS